MKGVRVIVSGRVQGVAYRDWTRRQAKALGIDGWVRNRRDGTVEAVFAGEDAAIDELIAACRAGPAAADVTDVRIVSDDEPPQLGFEIGPTV